MTASLPKTIIKQHKCGNAFYLYDEALIENAVDTTLFPCGTTTVSNKSAIGRGDAIFFHYDGLSLVAKHYQRGGLVAKLLHDKYFGFKLESTRAYREWRLLHHMLNLGLPVPRPVVAKITKHGLFYQADMIMLELESTTTLADMCMQESVEDEVWASVGRCINQFHNNGIYHADLNARNILIDASSNVYLIDFDKSYSRLQDESWKASNLSRLKRSLSKFISLNETFHFNENNWDSLLKGYSE